MAFTLPPPPQPPLFRIADFDRQPVEGAKTMVMARIRADQVRTMNVSEIQKHLEDHGFDFSSGAGEIGVDNDIFSGEVVYCQAVRIRPTTPRPQPAPLDLSGLRDALRRGWKR